MVMKVIYVFKYCTHSNEKKYVMFQYQSAPNHSFSTDEVGRADSVWYLLYNVEKQK